MTANLTIIIPFLNERDNVHLTLENIYKTVSNKNNIEIILINDSSNDDYNYDALYKKFNCHYLFNKERKGIAKCRDIGVELAETPYIMFLDAHMMFYEKNWDLKFIQHLNENPETIYCTKSISMDDNWEINSDWQGNGVYIQNFETSDGFLDFHWLEGNITQEIPCIMGGCYFFHRSFYQDIGGLYGLEQWGLDEQYLSIKSYMAGGKCCVISDVILGHIYKAQLPYKNKKSLFGYNQLYILFTILSEEEAISFIEPYRQTITEFDKALKLIQLNKQHIDDVRDFLAPVLSKKSFSQFLEYNQTFRDF